MKTCTLEILPSAIAELLKLPRGVAVVGAGFDSDKGVVTLRLKDAGGITNMPESHSYPMCTPTARQTVVEWDFSA